MNTQTQNKIFVDHTNCCLTWGLNPQNSAGQMTVSNHFNTHADNLKLAFDYLYQNVKNTYIPLSLQLLVIHFNIIIDFRVKLL